MFIIANLQIFDFFLKFLVVHPDSQILKPGRLERNLIVIDDRTSVIFSSDSPCTYQIMVWGVFEI